MPLNELFKRIVLMMYGEHCIACPTNRRRLATTVHHLWPKGMGGCSLNTRYNPLNGVPVCEECHRRIHDVVGEVVGRNEIIKKLPHLLTHNHKTTPLLGDTERKVRTELKGMYE
jgi:hypothetical protein